MGNFLSFLQYEHECGWTVQYELAGTKGKDVLRALTEPDQKKINEVWARVDMPDMHSVKLIHDSEDGNRGGRGTIYENYNKKGVAQNRHKIIHYEVQNGGKSIYTEGIYVWVAPSFPFKQRDEDQIRILFTDLDNGNCHVHMEILACMQMRCFCECCIPLMYPMEKFQQAMQDVISPNADASKVPKGTLVMKKELVYTINRQSPLLGVTDKEGKGGKKKGKKNGKSETAQSMEEGAMADEYMSM